VLDAAIIDADGRVAATRLPTQQLPVRADVLSPLAWQCETRAGVVAYVRLPAGAALRTVADPAKSARIVRRPGRVCAPFVMAWYWMSGGLLYRLIRGRHEPLYDAPSVLPEYPPVSILVPCHNEGR
jgi:Hypothetical glycosyl hydrolase family 13